VPENKTWEEGNGMIPCHTIAGMHPSTGWVRPSRLWLAALPFLTSGAIAADASAADLALPGASGPDASPVAVLSRFDREFAAREGYMRPLEDRGWLARFRALRDLTRFGARASSALAGALAPLDGTDTLDRRVLAAQALSWTGDPGAEEALVRSLRADTSASVRLYAADAIGVVRTTAGLAALEQVRETDSNGDARAHAGFALERKGRESWDEARRMLLEFDDRRLDAARLGEEAPTFRLPGHDGVPVDLADLRGKSSVILIFIYGDT
jgi:HEAT repeat protein